MKKKGIIVLILALCCCVFFGCTSPSNGNGGDNFDPVQVTEDELPVVPID